MYTSIHTSVTAQTQPQFSRCSSAGALTRKKGVRMRFSLRTPSWKAVLRLASYPLPPKVEF